MTMAKEGKSHQDSAPNVEKNTDGPEWKYLSPIGDINLKTAATPHFVKIIRYSVIIQHLNVSNYALTVGKEDTPCKSATS